MGFFEAVRPRWETVMHACCLQFSWLSKFHWEGGCIEDVFIGQHSCLKPFDRVECNWLAGFPLVSFSCHGNKSSLYLCSFTQSAFFHDILSGNFLWWTRSEFLLFDVRMFYCKCCFLWHVLVFFCIYWVTLNRQPIFNTGCGCFARLLVFKFFFCIVYCAFIDHTTVRTLPLMHFLASSNLAIEFITLVLFLSLKK